MITTVDEANKNLGKRAAGIDPKLRSIVCWGTVIPPLHSGNAKPFGLKANGKTHRFDTLYTNEDLDDLCQDVTNLMEHSFELWQRCANALAVAIIMQQAYILKEGDLR